MGVFDKRKQFAGNRNGTVLLPFALILVVIIACVGVATDIHFKEITKNKLVHMLDAAGLTAAKAARLDPSLSVAELTNIAQSALDAQAEDSPEMRLQSLNLTKIGDQLKLNVEGKMDTGIMHFFGRDEMDLKIETKYTFGLPAQLEIALVLDMSNSMNANIGHGTRLDALQGSAKRMVEALVDPDSNKVKMSIVPFNSHARIQKNLRGAAWLRVEPNSTSDTTRCDYPYALLEKKCVWRYETDYNDGVPIVVHRRDCSGANLDPDDRVCVTTQVSERWFGCVGSRRAPRDLSDSGYLIEPVFGFVSHNKYACADTIQKLTNDQQRLLNKVNDLRAHGQTYIPAGLMWGLRTLSPRAPYSGPLTYNAYYNQGGIKAVVLMSDGANESSPRWNGGPDDGKHWDTDTDQANTNTFEVCELIQRKQIEVYTIAFGVDDAQTKTLLQTCASSDQHSFTAENADELEDAFSAITAHLQRDIAVAS